MEQSLTAKILKGKNKQKGGGTKKHGRNLVKCKHYRTVRSLKNKVAKLQKHLKVHANDKCAKTAFAKIA